MVWMKFYSRDALGDPMLRMVGPEARGVWYDMLWLMDIADRRGYLTRNGHPWPDDELCRVLAVTPDELVRAKDKLLAAGVPSVEPGTGIWYNRRMVRDEQRRVTGAKYGREGGGNPALHPPAPPEGQDQRPEAICQKLEARTPIKETFIGLDKGKDKPTLPADFEEFWKAYPNKAGKKDALKAWRNAKDKPPLVELLAAIAAQRKWQGWTKDNGQFIPQPATWLNKGRWDDKPVEAPQPMRNHI
jgi:hypothetical protein